MPVWPFRKARVEKAKQPSPNEPIARLGKQWLDDLREECEKAWEIPEEGRRKLRQFLVEWKDFAERGELDATTLGGLERRARHLLRCDNSEWKETLDNEKFWRPGWRIGD